MKTFVKEKSRLQVLDVRSLPVKQSSVIPSSGLSLFRAFKHLGMLLLRRLTETPELQVWQTCDARGNCWWYARDILTGRSIDRVPEDTLRIWIEERYYQ